MTLAEQIRALYGTRGDWNQGGIDRAQELADLLMKAGVTDVSQLKLLNNMRQEMQSLGAESDGQTTLVETPINQVQFGDRTLGFVGDYNNDNTFGNNASDYLQEGNVLGWSARGKGNVKYRVGTDAQGNNYLTPEWGSSSDMADVRNILKVAAIAAGMHYGLPMLGGETAAAAAGAGEAAAAGGGLLGGGGSALTPAAIEAGLGTAGYGYNASAAASGMFNPATIGAGAGLTFGPTAASTLAGAGSGASTLTPAAIEAGIGTPGYGFNASAAASGMFDPATIGAGAGLAFGPAAAGTLAGAGSGALTSAAGAGAAGGLLKAALPIAGAVLGGTSGGKTATATTTKDMDPRLANYVYGPDGTGGLLGSATKLFNDQMATGGLNELQRQGIDMQKNYLMNPAYAQGYTNMMNVGQGLLSGGVAGNPFRR